MVESKGDIVFPRRKAAVLSLIGSLVLALMMAAGTATAQTSDPVYQDRWSGFYAGGNLDFQTGVPLGPEILSVHAGRNQTVGAAVLGGELELSRIAAGAPGGSISFMSRLKARAGVPFGATMLYAVGGAVRAETTMGPEYGLVAGIGVERQITNRWTVGGELLHHEFPSFDGKGRHTVQAASARLSYRF